MLRRLVLKLVRSGERRPIARAATYVWIGLERVDSVWFVGKPPLNLVPTACANLAIDRRRVALRPGDARLLDATSPDPRAVLRVGATVQAGAFADRPRLTVPLASVIESCKGGADRLAVQGGDGSEVLLARFTVRARWLAGRRASTPSARSARCCSVSASPCSG